MVDTNAAMIDIPRTQGALLLGGLFSAGFSGIVAIQVVVYFKLYPSDEPSIKTLVLIVWLLDLIHTGFTWAAIWDYLIAHYGDATIANTIPLSLSFTCMFTGILTFFVHCFFTHRIYRLSKKDWYITSPIVFLAVCRLCSALATSAEMIRIRDFVLFKQKFRWLFSLGLALSSAVDVLVTLSLFVLLQISRSSSLTLDHVIDSLILYAVEIGSLTCAGSIASMICWLTMSDNMVFMAIHFIVGKFYANSFLATLIARYGLRRSDTAHELTPPSGACSSRDIHRAIQFRVPLPEDSESSGQSSQVPGMHIDMEKSMKLAYDDDR